jgi:short-subunit dehydrogenase
MAQLTLKNKWILITGASSGLGREIARYLAKNEHANVVIAARRVDRLETLKQEIESTYNTRVEILRADLGNKTDVDDLFEKAAAMAEIYAVINNAGITFYNPSTEAELDTFERIVNVNLMAPMRLSLKFLTYFIEKGEGAILNITSETGLLPVPYQNAYSASKHAIQAFTEGLYMEYRHYRKKGIFISSFAPGGIVTEMITNAGLDKKIKIESAFNMKAEAVARKAVKTLKKKKFIAVPGFLNKATVFVARFLPRKALARFAEFIYRPPSK